MARMDKVKIFGPESGAEGYLGLLDKAATWPQRFLGRSGPPEDDGCVAIWPEGNIR